MASRSLADVIDRRSGVHPPLSMTGGPRKLKINLIEIGRIRKGESESERSWHFRDGTRERIAKLVCTRIEAIRSALYLLR